MKWADRADDMPDAVEVTFGDIGAGFVDHNLRCPLCNERFATWWGNPVWLFSPCKECRREYRGLEFDETAEFVRDRKKTRAQKIAEWLFPWAN